MLQVLKSRKLTVVLLLALLPLAIFESQVRSVPGYVFAGYGAALALNLALCLIDHIRRVQKWTVQSVGFILFHAALLVIMTGGIATYVTYTIGYVEIAEGNGFTDKKEYYSDWKQKFGARQGTGINIYVKKIALDFWENGQIKEFHNTILIEDRGKLTEEVVRVNGSVEYGPLLINMARFYGLAPRFTLKTPHGDESGYVYIRSETKANHFEIPHLGYKAFVYYSDAGSRELEVTVLGGKEPVFRRKMRAGDVIDLGQAQLELTRVDLWNGLTVVTDSGKGITYAGFGLFLLGLGLFYGKKLYGGAH